MNTADNSPLGKQSEAIDTYTNTLLFPIPRSKSRASLNIKEEMPFYGYDHWQAYEISWLTPKGKPQVVMADIIVPCDSHNLIESKSLKLYLNSFNQTTFESHNEVAALIEKDLSHVSEAVVKVDLLNEEQVIKRGLTKISGILIDDCDISCDTFTPDPMFLKVSSREVSETLYSHLLRSNCPVTNQPDWATISIRYTGPEIDKAGLLKYIVSYRQHQDFHEHCVEQVFCDIKQHCEPKALCVCANFTRRGGLDINPYRADTPIDAIKIQRLFRQ